MRQASAIVGVIAAAGLVFSATVRAADPLVTGDYVEARTAEVFTGPCIMGSEGEVSGKEAIMAWRVSRGAMNGVSLDGLAIVAVVSKCSLSQPSVNFIAQKKGSDPFSPRRGQTPFHR